MGTESQNLKEGAVAEACFKSKENRSGKDNFVMLISKVTLGSPGICVDF